MAMDHKSIIRLSEEERACFRYIPMGLRGAVFAEQTVVKRITLEISAEKF